MQETVTWASSSLHQSVDGSAQLGAFTVQLPEDWREADCGLHLPSSHYIGVSLTLSSCPHC